MQLAGGGLVPLSHAVCCRPCLPRSLPEDPTGVIPANDSAVAVVSIGCHASTAVGAHPPLPGTSDDYKRCRCMSM